MDNSKIVFLINDQVRAVRAIYEEEAQTNQKKHVFKTLDQELAVDDLAIVETSTRHGYAVVKIVEADIDVNFDDPIELKWVVQRLDQSVYAGIKKQEAAAISAVQQAELRRKKAELRATMFKDHEESIAQLALATPIMPTE